jgi:hypothetical protein
MTARSSSTASSSDSNDSVTRSAPSRATRPDSLLRLVTSTRHPETPGSSGRTWLVVAALSNTTRTRRPASRDRYSADRDSRSAGIAVAGTFSARRNRSSTSPGVTGGPGS